MYVNLENIYNKKVEQCCLMFKKTPNTLDILIFLHFLLF